MLHVTSNKRVVVVVEEEEEGRKEGVFFNVLMFLGRNGGRNAVPMLSASSREKPRHSATTHAHAIITGARFTTVNLCLSASSSKISWKSRPSSNDAAAPPFSSAAPWPLLLGSKYSFFFSESIREDDGDDDDDDASDGPGAVPCLRFFRGEDDVGGDEGGDDEGGSGGGGDDEGGARFICRECVRREFESVSRSVGQSVSQFSRVRWVIYRGRLSGCVIYVLIAIVFSSWSSVLRNAPLLCDRDCNRTITGCI